MWEAIWRRATVDGAAVRTAEALTSRWRLLVLTADWCGDAVNVLPVIARLAAECPTRLELRCHDRDQHLELMDDHLTDGTRAIPKVLMIDAEWRVRGSWGPRPAELQAWIVREGRALVREERYKHVRAWYARDKGASAVREVLAALAVTVATR